MSDYMTNSSTIDFGKEEELLKENTKLTQEKETLEKENKERIEEYNALKIKYEDLELELIHQKEINKNQDEMITFYKNQPTLTDESENKIKDLEVQLMVAEDRANEITTEAETLTLENEDLKREKKELSEMNENMINMLTEKEMEMKATQKELDALKETKKEEETKALSQNDLSQFKELYQELEQEYENYKAETETKVSTFNNEKSELKQTIDNQEAKIEELESEVNKQKEEIQALELEKIQLELDKHTALNNQRQELMAEVESMNIQIRELRISKEKLMVNSDAEKNFVVSERKAIEDKYNKIKEQKAELENQFNQFQEKKQKELIALQEKLKNELDLKLKEYTQLNDIKTKIEAKIELLKKEVDIKETAINSFDKSIKEQKDKFNEEKAEIEKKISEMTVKNDIEKNTLNNRIKELLHKNVELNNQLEEKIMEINQSKENKNMTMGTLMDDNEAVHGKDKEEALLKEIDEQKKIITQLKQETKYYEKTIADLKTKLSNSGSEKLIAENEFLNKNIESLKKQGEALKTKNEKDIEYYKKELRDALDSVSLSKCQFAALTFEKENEIVKLRGYIKRLKTKLESMGFAIKGK